MFEQSSIVKILRLTCHILLISLRSMSVRYEPGSCCSPYYSTSFPILKAFPVMTGFASPSAITRNSLLS